ncbi:MAG: hypothetical protein EXS05_24635 [Planctomycetaceae bacterium]|nr:hypothetical protein [Planctomycetaceae bacterium]
MSTSMLLGSEQVQKELKISDEQKEKLTALRGEAGRGGRGGGGAAGAGGGGRPNFQDMTEEELEKFRADMRKAAEEANKKVEEILSADQLKRVKEIAVQVNGIATNVQNPAIAKTLNLSEEQAGQIKTISDETGKRMRELFQPGGDRDAARKEMEELRKNAEEEYTAVLSDEQKAQLEKMKGAKFEFDRSTLFPGGGGRGRRGNNAGAPNT